MKWMSEDNLAYFWSKLKALLSGKKDVQSAKESPSTSGDDIAFIDTISQNANGEITATRKNVREASESQSGVINTGAQTIAGNKTMTGSLTFNNVANAIRFKNASADYPMIKFIEGASGDTSGHGISIGGGGLVVIGAGESSDAISSGRVGGGESLHLGADSDVTIYSSVQNGVESAKKFSFQDDGNFVAQNGIVVSGNLTDTAERQVRARSSAGQIMLFSQGSATGNRGIWTTNNAGTGANVISIPQNNVPTFHGPAMMLGNFYSSRPASANTNFGDGYVRQFKATASMTTGNPGGDSHILHFAWDNTGGWDNEIAVRLGGGTTTGLQWRGQNGDKNAWSNWCNFAMAPGAAAVGSETRPVYMGSNGLVTKCTDSSLALSSYRNTTNTSSAAGTLRKVAGAVMGGGYVVIKTNMNINDGVTVGNLPAGWRPSETAYGVGMCTRSGTGMTVHVETGGNIKITSKWGTLSGSASNTIEVHFQLCFHTA